MPRGDHGFQEHPERINKKGRPRSGQSLAELARQFMKGDVEVTVPDKQSPDGKRIEKVNRTLLFLEAVYNRATRGSDAAARLLWNYIDGLPPFTGRLGPLGPDDGAEVKPEDEERIRQHLETLILGKRNGNGNGGSAKK